MGPKDKDYPGFRGTPPDFRWGELAAPTIAYENLPLPGISPVPEFVQKLRTPLQGFDQLMNEAARKRNELTNYETMYGVPPSSTPARQGPMEVHGQPYDFGTLEIFMHKDAKGVYAPHFLVPKGIEVLTGNKGEPIGLYNLKTGRTWGLPTKGPKHPFVKMPE